MTDERIMGFRKDLIDLIRKTTPQAIAEDIVGVQPMENLDFEALAEHPLWKSFCKRHFKDND